MSDWYRDFANSGVGTTLTKQLGLPRPAVLRRYAPGDPLLPGPAVIGSAGEGRLRDAADARSCADAGVTVQSPVTADGGTDGERPAAVLLDATGLRDAGRPGRARTTSSRPAVKRLRPHRPGAGAGRPARRGRRSPAQAAARQALDGLVRSLGKELRDGATANLLVVPEGAEAGLAGPVRFFLSGRSAYVDGQVVTLSAGRAHRPTAGRPSAPLAGKVAVVTGAARGIGAAIAGALARDGAHVVAVDIPAAGESLAAGRQRDRRHRAAARHHRRRRRRSGWSSTCGERHGGVDVVVHNAGITRDKLLVNMDAARWNSVMAVNLQAQLDITQALLDADGVLQAGRPGRRGQLAVGHRRQPRPDQLRGVQGRRHRHGARVGAGLRRARARRSTPSRRASSSPR